MQKIANAKQSWTKYPLNISERSLPETSEIFIKRSFVLVYQYVGTNLEKDFTFSDMTDRGTNTPPRKAKASESTVPYAEIASRLWPIIPIRYPKLMLTIKNIKLLSK